MPRHAVEQGESASERGKGARRRAVVHAWRRDEDELLPDILYEGVSRARLGCAGLRLVGLLVGCATAAVVGLLRCFMDRMMPFGLKNAGATYQWMMQKCLATQIGKNFQVYIDDVVITTKQGSTLIEDLKETFENLDKFCLKLNPTKCSFGVPAG
ncbi:hypothetical protein QYE76_046556 [Lolium multiflorum]|uniref:Reverse transcriptase domain-containing protein n=1 Tax=Lolium multiflorum TaxID=4521 RepID=A0AAD8TPR2_LOLMU|nr:hypothetical protein QYE76_046556 [Lolium multiflorum]